MRYDLLLLLVTGIAAAVVVVLIAYGVARYGRRRAFSNSS